jgi:hypothetical protein
MAGGRVPRIDAVVTVGPAFGSPRSFRSASGLDEPEKPVLR